jgi:hypothetical protein
MTESREITYRPLMLSDDLDVITNLPHEAHAPFRGCEIARLGGVPKHSDLEPDPHVLAQSWRAIIVDGGFFYRLRWRN